MNEREAYIALNMMEKIGPVGVRGLVAELGSAAAVFAAEAGRLQAAEGVGPDAAGAIVRQRESIRWQEEIERVEARGWRLLTPVEEEYPRWLKEIHDPPLALYVRGTLQLRDRRSIAVVGSRRPTHYGRTMAERLAYGLAAAGVTVVSGLALGVDTLAHQGALKARGRTLAVLGSGLDVVYPSANEGLAGSIAGQGAVLSEFPLGRQPDRTTFPMRNRIVSGLSEGVVVVEAGLSSGALITAREAMEQGRTVFAVPGRVDVAVARGPNRLIRDGARLVESSEDILSEYDLFGAGHAEPGAGSAHAAGAAAGRGARACPPLNEEERAVVAALDGAEGNVDALIRASGLPAAAVNAALLSLEMKRVVRMLPGRIVERV